MQTVAGLLPARADRDPRRRPACWRALVAGYAIWRRRELRNADVLILLVIALGLAIVAGTEIPDALLSAFSFERENGTRIVGVAIFAILILFLLVLRALSAGLADHAAARRRCSRASPGSSSASPGIPERFRDRIGDPGPGLQRGRQRRRGARPDPGGGLRGRRPPCWSSTTARATAPTRSPARTAPIVARHVINRGGGAALRTGYRLLVRLRGARSSSRSTPTASTCPRRWSGWCSRCSTARWRWRTARGCSARRSRTTRRARPGSSSSTSSSRSSPAPTSPTARTATARCAPTSSRSSSCARSSSTPPSS